jgi:5'-phosphate synthase pdxT subunit
VDAFILPGGESTTMLKLIEAFDLWDELAAQFFKKTRLGHLRGFDFNRRKSHQPRAEIFSACCPSRSNATPMAASCKSSHAIINGYDISLIRAPVIVKVANDVTVKAEHEGKPVWVEKGRYMATTFHPELTLDYPSPMHREFVNLVQNYDEKAA